MKHAVREVLVRRNSFLPEYGLSYGCEMRYFARGAFLYLTLIVRGLLR